jgi:hypothetical protein
VNGTAPRVWHAAARTAVAQAQPALEREPQRVACAGPPGCARVSAGGRRCGTCPSHAVITPPGSSSRAAGAEHAADAGSMAIARVRGQRRPDGGVPPGAPALARRTTATPIVSVSTRDNTACIPALDWGLGRASAHGAKRARRDDSEWRSARSVREFRSLAGIAGDGRAGVVIDSVAVYRGDVTSRVPYWGLFPRYCTRKSSVLRNAHTARVLHSRAPRRLHRAARPFRTAGSDRGCCLRERES